MRTNNILNPHNDTESGNWTHIGGRWVLSLLCHPSPISGRVKLLLFYAGAEVGWGRARLINRLREFCIWKQLEMVHRLIFRYLIFGTLISTWPFTHHSLGSTLCNKRFKTLHSFSFLHFALLSYAFSCFPLALNHWNRSYYFLLMDFFLIFSFWILTFSISSYKIKISANLIHGFIKKYNIY